MTSRGVGAARASRHGRRRRAARASVASRRERIDAVRIGLLFGQQQSGSDDKRQAQAQRRVAGDRVQALAPQRPRARLPDGDSLWPCPPRRALSGSTNPAGRSSPASNSRASRERSVRVRQIRLQRIGIDRQRRFVLEQPAARLRRRSARSAGGSPSATASAPVKSRAAGEVGLAACVACRRSALSSLPQRRRRRRASKRRAPSAAAARPDTICPGRYARTRRARSAP